MSFRSLAVGLLLVLSGFAALVLQVGWLREFRLIFGTTTAAASAVLAIFMAGVGLGSAIVGRLVDRPTAGRCSDPLRLYGMLLAGIALTAGLSPYLLELVRTIYVSLGGQARLGMAGAAAVRLGLSVLALGVPTFLIGGTLPAAVQAATRADDRQRRGVGWLFGLNELGAVAGAACSTLWLLEAIGTRRTLLLAAGIDLLAGAAALVLARSARLAQRRESVASDAAMEIPPSPLVGEGPGVRGRAAERPGAAQSPDTASRPSAPLLYATAALLGFAFFLMELVWYRMLAPLLGGSAYTFGIILTIVLAGIGAGGWAYALLARGRRFGLGTLAVCVAVEGLCIALPLVLGDRLAVLAAVLRPLAGLGFGSAATAWITVAAIVVLPASVAGGLQFALLIGLLGEGDEHVGRQVGAAFAWNTAGAIAGSLAGGFGLLPWLTAVGAWRAVAVGLAGLAGVLALGARRGAAARSGEETSRSGSGLLLLPPAMAGLVVAVLAVGGPTAFWRHSGIGAGRFELAADSANQLHNQENTFRRATIWEAEGIENSVALVADNGLAFYVAGKSDGNAVTDAGTQIMLPLLGALLHPRPKSAFVVGLGTGESAGWLADVDTIDEVTVAELEPAMAHVARECSVVNRRVLDNPKVRLVYDDARELLATSPATYDLIISEPSNPYRAGIAGLYTDDFYRAVTGRLNEGGLFLQWLQSYEVDTPTVLTVMATLSGVFEHIELWQTEPGDMAFVCSRRPLAHSADELRARLGTQPFNSALLAAWHTADLEGLLAHWLAGRKLIDAALADRRVPINTDDRNILEYGMARTLGRTTAQSAPPQILPSPLAGEGPGVRGPAPGETTNSRGLFSLAELRAAAARIGDDRPPITGDIAWQQVTAERWLLCLASGEPIPAGATLSEAEQARLTAFQLYWQGRLAEALQVWESAGLAAESLAEKRLLAHCYADQGSLLAELWIARVSLLRGTDAELLSALLAARSGRPERAVEQLVAAYALLQSDPWCEDLATMGLNLALELSKAEDTTRATRLREALAKPFAGRLLDSRRLATRLTIAQELPLEVQLQEFLAFEPHVPWTLGFLQARERVYAAMKHPLAAQAARDLKAFEQAADDEPLLPPPPHAEGSLPVDAATTGVR